MAPPVGSGFHGLPRGHAIHFHVTSRECICIYIYICSSSCRRRTSSSHLFPTPDAQSRCFCPVARLLLEAASSLIHKTFCSSCALKNKKDRDLMGGSDDLIWHHLGCSRTMDITPNGMSWCSFAASEGLRRSAF